MARPLPHSWFKEEAVALAPRLLGKTIRKDSCAGIIVEVEAYMGDAASHARKLTPRSRIMHETYGHWYVYFTYGMHYCVNATAGMTPGGILIRAVEPMVGIPLMQKRRGVKDVRNLTNGPAKLTQAFAITKTENGLPISGDFVIEDAPELPSSSIASGPRIGIKAATDLPWRFWIKGNEFVSK